MRAFGATLTEQIELTGNWLSTPTICQTAAIAHTFTEPRA
jgi:hypothetical protein